MKQPKALTREQKEVVSSHGLPAKNYMLVEEMEFYLKLIHKDTEKIKIIDKFKRGGRR